MFSDVPTKFEVKANQDEPLAVKLKIGENVLKLGLSIILLTVLKIRKNEVKAIATALVTFLIGFILSNLINGFIHNSGPSEITISFIASVATVALAITAVAQMRQIRSNEEREEKSRMSEVQRKMGSLTREATMGLVRDLHNKNRCLKRASKFLDWSKGSSSERSVSSDNIEKWYEYKRKINFYDLSVDRAKLDKLFTLINFGIEQGVKSSVYNNLFLELETIGDNYLADFGRNSEFMLDLEDLRTRKLHEYEDEFIAAKDHAEVLAKLTDKLEEYIDKLQVLLDEYRNIIKHR